MNMRRLRGILKVQQCPFGVNTWSLGHQLFVVKSAWRPYMTQNMKKKKMKIDTQGNSEYNDFNLVKI